MNLRLEVTPEMSFQERLKGLNKGKYDLIATETTVTTRSKDSLLFRPQLCCSASRYWYSANQKRGKTVCTYTTNWS